MLLVALMLMAADDPLAMSAKSAIKLHKPVDVTFEREPLGKLVRTFAKDQELDLLIDWRVDVSGPAQGGFKQTPVEKILSEMARYAAAKMVVIGDVVYIGPTETADRAAAASVKARSTLAKLPESVRKQMLAKRALDLSKDKTLEDYAKAMVKESGLEFDNSGDFDLTAPDAHIKEITKADAFSLFGAMVDRTWRIDEKRKVILLEDLPEDAKLEREIRGLGVPEAKRRAEMYKKLELPDLTVTIKSGTLKLEGSWSALWTAERTDRLYRASLKTAMKNKSTGKKAKGKAVKRYTVNFKNTTLEQFTASLYETTKIPIEIDEESLTKAEIPKDVIINCIASGVLIDDLLELALGPAGLTFERSDDRIVIKAK